MAWTNGRKNLGGVAFGFNNAAEYRDQLPPQRQPHFVTVNVAKPSFCSGCRELIDKDIEKWMLRCGYAPWLKGKPPEFDVERLEAGAFPIRGLAAVRGRQ